MEIQLLDTNLRNALSEAMLAAITPAAREELIRDALKNLVTPQQDYSGRPKNVTPIQEAMASVTSKIMEEVVTKLVNEDLELRAKIEVFAREAISRMLGPDVEFMNRFVEAFRKSFSGGEY